MSRTKRDRIETEAMLCRLTVALSDATPSPRPMNAVTAARTDAESLRRISMTLHRWHELECGDSNAHNSYSIVRGQKIKHDRVRGAYTFNYDDAGKPYLEVHHNSGGTSHQPIADRERGALKRLAKIMARYPGLQAYVQTDPRGCALYILRPGDVPDGSKVDEYYSRGVAVHQ